MANTVLIDRNVSDPRLNSGPMVTNQPGQLGRDRGPDGGLTGDFHYFHRPFISGRTGKKSVFVRPKRRDGSYDYTVNRGKREPIRRSMPVMKALEEGYQVPLFALNATTLRPDQWIEVDKKVVLASRQPLVAWEDLRKANSYGGFDAYGRMTLEYQAMSDPGEAMMDIDLMTQARHDQPLFVNRSVPLLCTHADFWFSDRFMQISANDSEPIDSLTGEAMAQRVGEMVEDVTIGQVAGPTYGTQTAGSHTHQGTSTAYGFANFTYRTNKTNLTTPTGSNPQATISDVLAMIQTLKNMAYQGPFMLYNSLAWDQFLDNDYAFTNGTNWAVNPSQTLRARLKAIPAIQDVKTLPRWSAPIMSGGSAGTYAFILIDLKVAGRAIDGVAPTTLQWDTIGGMRHNFKVWAIQVPNMLAQYNTQTPLVYATTS